MRKTKMSNEERDKLIDEIVREKIAEQKAIDAHKAMLNFVEEALSLGVTHHKFGNLGYGYLMNVAKQLINNDSFDEQERCALRAMFSNDFIYVGSRGYKPEDEDKIDSFRKKLIECLGE